MRSVAGVRSSYLIWRILMPMISRIAAVSAVLLSVGSATGQEKAAAVVVTQETYCRAETDRTFSNATKLTGGVRHYPHS